MVKLKNMLHHLSFVAHLKLYNGHCARKYRKAGDNLVFDFQKYSYQGMDIYTYMLFHELHSIDELMDEISNPYINDTVPKPIYQPPHLY